MTYLSVSYQWVVVGVTFMAALVHSLDTGSVREGPCLPNQRPDPAFNMTWFETTPLPYFIGGSKFNMYNVVSGHPLFTKMRDWEFYYDSCISYNLANGVAIFYAFDNRVIARSDYHPYTHHGVIDLNFTPLPRRPGLHTHFIRHYVTISDNKTWAFFSNCWEDINQRSWSVLATQPSLDAATLRLIEDHAAALGYDREQFAFFRRETCENT